MFPLQLLSPSHAGASLPPLTTVASDPLCPPPPQPSKQYAWPPPTLLCGLVHRAVCPFLGVLGLCLYPQPYGPAQQSKPFFVGDYKVYANFRVRVLYGDHAAQTCEEETT